jgi:ribosome biogenesis protein BMS1
MRFLKYTPKYDFCTAILYGNFVQQNSGIIFSQTVRNDLKKFRIAASGLVLEINKSYEVKYFFNSGYEKNKTDRLAL